LDPKNQSRVGQAIEYQRVKPQNMGLRAGLTIYAQEVGKLTNHAWMRNIVRLTGRYPHRYAQIL
jgi:hypothetical protein